MQPLWGFNKHKINNDCKAFQPSIYSRATFFKESPLFYVFFFVVIICTYLSFRDLSYISVNDHSKLISSEVGSVNGVIIEPVQYNILKVLGSIGYDNSDAQWRSFSGNFFVFGSFLVIFALGARLVRVFLSAGQNNRKPLAYFNPHLTFTPLQQKKMKSEMLNGDGPVSSELLHAVFGDNYKNGNTKLNEDQRSDGAYITNNANNVNKADNVNDKTSPLIWYYFIFGLLFVSVVHGPRVFFMFFFCLLNYFIFPSISPHLPTNVYVLILFIFHIAILFLNEHYHGYRFSSLFSAIFGANNGKIMTFLTEIDDGKWQMFPWHIVFNMSTLRMISFAVDYDEALKKGMERRDIIEERHRNGCVDCLINQDSPCYKVRTDSPRQLKEYNLANYLAFLLYIPLYIAGPMISFNSFVSHVYIPQRCFKFFNFKKDFKLISDGDKDLFDCKACGRRKDGSRISNHLESYEVNVENNNSKLGRFSIFNKKITCQSFSEEKVNCVNCMHSFRNVVNNYDNDNCGVLYFIRILMLYLVLIIILHFTHINAIRANVNYYVSELNVAEKLELSFFILAFLWLKFSFIWKFSRAVAMIDGVEAPEDMKRCFANAVTISYFWRDWHASFNLWIIRYMYIPMGGSRTRLFTIFPIFAFVALWHDIEMHLFLWCLIICIGFVPEIICMSYFSTLTKKILGNSCDINKNALTRDYIESNNNIGWYFIDKEMRRLFTFLLKKPFYYRICRSVLSFIPVLFLCLANIVGYGTGTFTGKTCNKNISLDIKAGSTREVNCLGQRNQSLFGSIFFEYPLFTFCFIIFAFSCNYISWRTRDITFEKYRRICHTLGITNKEN